MRISIRIGLAIAALVVTVAASQAFIFRLWLNVYADQLRSRLFAPGLALSAATAKLLAQRGATSSYPDSLGTHEQKACTIFYNPAGYPTAETDCQSLATPSPLQPALRARAAAQVGTPILLNMASFAAPVALLVALPEPQQNGYLAVYERTPPRSLLSMRNRSLLTMTAAVVLIALLATWFVARRIRKGIQRAQLAVRSIADGGLDERLPWQADDELGALAWDFNRMAERLQQLVTTLREENARRRGLVAALSHELNTPLTSVLGYLDSLRLPDIDGTPDKRQRYVRVAFEQAQALASLVEDLDTVSRLDLGDLTLHYEQHALADLIAREVEALAQQAHAAQVKVAFFKPPQSDTRVWLDPQRIAQVLRNLLDNAIRHAPAQSVVAVELSARERALVVAITDQGDGIPEGLRHRIGEPLLRADPSRARRTGGRGLGLAITRGLLEAHGGKLTISNAEPRGTTVRFFLPLHPCAAAQRVTHTLTRRSSLAATPCDTR